MIGYSSIVYQGFVWRLHQGGLLPLSPPKLIDEFINHHAERLLEDENALFIRWESHFDYDKELPWWHVIKEQHDALESLPKKTRYMIRKANDAFDVRRISKVDVLKDGYQVYVRAYERYDTYEKMYDYQQFCNAVSEVSENTEFWGVFDIESNKLVAFSENYIEGATCFYVSMWINPDVMNQFAGYLLFYRMEQDYLGERGFEYISDGARSLSHDTNIHDFLIQKFRFRKAYSCLNVKYRYWLRVLINISYPFRVLTNYFSLDAFKKANVLLKQEEIRRECESRMRSS